MPWTTDVKIDTDKTDVGTAAATWTALDGATFVYSRRLQINIAGRDAFITEAIAARDAWETHRQNEAAKASNLLTNLTAADA